MASFLPQYMQQDPTMSRRGTSTSSSTTQSGPQSMSSLLGIFNQMPQFQAQGIGEQKIRDLFGGSVGAARTFGMEQNRATAGERGAAPVSSGVAQQKATRLGLFTQAPMLDAILKDLAGTNLANNSYLAQLLGQLMQAASGPTSTGSSQGSSEVTDWRAPQAGEINPGTPRVQYPSQGGGGGGGTLGGSKMGGGLSNADWWSRTGPPSYPGSGGGYTPPSGLMSDEGIGSDNGYLAPSARRPNAPQPSEAWATGGLASPNVWNMPQELMSGAGLQTSGGGDSEWEQVEGGSGAGAFMARRRKGETGAYSRF